MAPKAHKKKTFGIKNEKWLERIGFVNLLSLLIIDVIFLIDNFFDYTGPKLLGKPEFKNVPSIPLAFYLPGTFILEMFAALSIFIFALDREKISLNTLSIIVPTSVFIVLRFNSKPIPDEYIPAFDLLEETFKYYFMISPLVQWIVLVNSAFATMILWKMRIIECGYKSFEVKNLPRALKEWFRVENEDWLMRIGKFNDWTYWLGIIVLSVEIILGIFAFKRPEVSEENTTISIIVFWHTVVFTIVEALVGQFLTAGVKIRTQLKFMLIHTPMAFLYTFNPYISEHRENVHLIYEVYKCFFLIQTIVVPILLFNAIFATWLLWKMRRTEWDYEYDKNETLSSSFHKTMLGFTNKEWIRMILYGKMVIVFSWLVAILEEHLYPSNGPGITIIIGFLVLELLTVMVLIGPFAISPVFFTVKSMCNFMRILTIISYVYIFCLFKTDPESFMIFKYPLSLQSFAIPVSIASSTFATWILWKMRRFEWYQEPCEVIYGGKDSSTKKLLEDI